MAATTTGTVDPADVFVQYRPFWRSRGLLVVLGVGLLVLILIGSVRATAFSPEAAVHAHFQALADRDLAAALDTLADEPSGNRDLLTPLVLTSEDYTPPMDVEIQDTTVDGGEAIVTVAFTVGGERHATSVRLRRGEGFWDSFQHWRLTDPFGELRFGEVPAEALVNGQRVGTASPGEPWSVPALFGGYQVRLPDDDPLWESQQAAVVVGPEAGAPVSLPLMARAEVRAEVERQLGAALDSCSASGEVRPPGCPFQGVAIIGALEAEWEITRYPQVDLTAAPDGFGQVQMVVTTTEPGEAVVTGVREFLLNEEPFEYVDTFTVSGVVTHQAGAVHFEPDW